MRDDILCHDPALNEEEPPICNECGEFMEIEVEGEHDPDTGRVVFSCSSLSCPNSDCPSNQ